MTNCEKNNAAKKFTFEEYQKLARDTANYPKIGEKIIYPTLGICEEAGEVSGKIKKIFRDKEGVFEKKDVEEITKELGDVLWYISQIAFEMGVNLEDVARKNIEKLADRKKRGVISGSGDNR